MNKAKVSSLFLHICMCAALFGALRLSADVVETTNGARIVGKVTKIQKGVVTVSTDFAGELNIKQVLVTSITTDHPVAVRFADGSGIVGVVSSPGLDKIRVVGNSGTVDSPVGNVAASWGPSEEDPDVVALRRKWSFQAGVDIEGTSGTHTQLGTSYNFLAKLIGPLDVLQYYTNYNRQETDSQVSADQFKVGVDYADNYTAVNSWYVKDEAGFDRVNDITFYDVAAGGLGHDFVKTPIQTLTARVGLSYRYDRYTPGTSDNLSSLGADLGLAYVLKLKNSQLSDKISFDPAFQDLGNFIITHELTFETPITKSLWKLDMGVTNNYDSRPAFAVEKLETIYFTRLVLAWGQGQPK